MKRIGITIFFLCAGAVVSALDQDCNHNGIEDRDEIAQSGGDCDGDGLLDVCEPDCDRDEIPDPCQILAGEPDVDRNEVPDICEPDCDGNGMPDALDIAGGAPDCDGDGVPDGCSTSASFGLAAPDYFTTREPHPLSLVAMDFDDDGRLDLAAAGEGSDVMSILSGRGARSFASAYPVEAIKIRGRILGGDFNGDRRPDLIQLLDDDLRLYANQGGRFAEPEPIQNFQNDASFFSPVAADFDGDGDLDLAAHAPDGLRVLTNDGTGIFSPAPQVPLAEGLVELAALDADDDGRTDLLAGLSSKVQVVFNRGPLDLQPGPAGDPGGDLSAITAADLDQDGDLDPVAGVNLFPGVVVLEMGAGGALERKGTVPLASFPVVLLAGDLDGDGDSDVAAIHSETGDPPASVSLLWNERNGSLAPGPGFGHVHGGLAALTADLDADGGIDLAVAASQGLQVFWNEGNGTLLDALRILHKRPVHSLAAGDLDGDGLLDLVAAEANPAFGLFFGDGRGGFEAMESPASGGMLQDAITADIDGDGDLDLAGGGMLGRSIGYAAVFSNQGSRGFLPAAEVRTGERIQALAAGDLDGDHLLDLVAADRSDPAIAVLTNRGGNEFSATRFPAGIAAPQTIVLGDLEGDGDLDAITTNGPSGDVAILLGSGRGDLGTARTIDLPGSAGTPALADLNDDGHLDLAVPSSAFLHRLVLFAGNGLSGLVESQAIIIPGSPNAAHAADLDGDGLADLAVTGHDLGGVAVLLQKPGAKFGLPFYLATSPNPGGIATGDFDGDRRLDLVVSGLSIALLFNRPRQPRAPDADGDGVPDACARAFLRCDSNGDGQVDIADGVWTISSLFLRGSLPPCRRAADCNADSLLDIADATFTIAFQLLGGPSPPQPYPACGVDSEGELPCDSPAACR